MTTHPFNVLYVEDDESDVDFARSMFGDFSKNIIVSVVYDGEAALKYLGLTGESLQIPKPDLILLDLNLPRIHGKEVLKLVKQSAELKKIPVVVLSTSKNQPDVDEIYALGASGYFQKPSEYKEYQQVFGAIYNYWMVNAALPSLTQE